MIKNNYKVIYIVQYVLKKINQIIFIIFYVLNKIKYYFIKLNVVNNIFINNVFNNG